MPPDQSTSGVLVQGMWDAFIVGWAQAYPGATVPSKREVARWMDCDTHALARWSNDASHAHDHPEWRIPLRRVFGLCEALGASVAARDELMFTRLREVQAQEEKSDVLMVLHWLEPVLAPAGPALDSHERQVLAAFNRARESIPGADGMPSPLDNDGGLEVALKNWLSASIASHHDELAAGQYASERQARVVASRALRVARPPRSTTVPSPASAPSTAQMQQTLRRFRRALRESVGNRAT